MNDTGESATAKELVAHIQREAMLASGVSPAALLRSHSAKAARLRAMSESQALRWEPEAAYAHVDPRRYGDLAQLKRDVPTPFQDPLLFAWLTDCWQGHVNSLYGGNGPAIQFLMGTAPTGRFNAIALPGSDGSAMVVEDGLIFFSQRASAVVAQVLYERAGNKTFLPRELNFSDTGNPMVDQACGELADLVLTYLIEGYVHIKSPPEENDEDFSVRHVIFLGLMSFVFEHEYYHIREFHQADKITVTRRGIVENRFKALWNLIEHAFRDEPRVRFDKERCERLFNAHSEEFFADLSGLVAASVIGQKSRTLAPSIDGALLFFFLADALQHAQRSLTDLDAYQAMAGMNDVTLTLNALIFEETHPYAELRLRALEEKKAAFNESIQKTINSEIAVLRQLFSRVKARLDQEIRHRGLTSSHLHPKWGFETRNLV